MNSEMDNRSAERMIHTAQLDREVKAWKKDGIWDNTVAWLKSTYYQNKSEAFVANMAKGAIATLKREHPDLSDDLLALNIKTFVDNKDRILSEFPGGYSESKWTDAEGKPISEKEAFDALALKDKLKMAMWGGQEYRDVQEARLQLEAKNKLSHVAEIVRYEQNNAPLDAIARALQTLKAVPEKTRGWIETAWKKLTRPENRKGLIMDAAVVGLCGVAMVALLDSRGFGKTGYADEVAVAPAAPVVRQLEKMTKTPDVVLTAVAPAATATESRGLVTKNLNRVEVVNVAQAKEWSIGEAGFDLTTPFSITIPSDTLSAVGMTGDDAHVGLNPMLEDQPAFRQDIAEFFSKWRESRNSAEIVRTHVDNLYAIGFHSGETNQYGALPGQFMDENASNPEVLVGQTIKLMRDGKEVTFKFTSVKRVDADLVGAGGAAVANASSTVPTAHIRLTELGFTEEEYKNADLVLFTCGKDGTGTFGERVFALLEIVEDEEVAVANEIAPQATAEYYANEYSPKVGENMDVAARKVTEWFESNSISIGEPFSYNDVMEHYQGTEWTSNGGIKKGAGACDIATLMYRAIKDYAEKNGIDPKLIDYRKGQEVWNYGLFTVVKTDHPEYEGVPVDEVVVESWAPGSSRNTDFIIEINESGKEVKFVILKDTEGNYRAYIVESDQILAKNN